MSPERERWAGVAWKDRPDWEAYHKRTNRDAGYYETCPCKGCEAYREHHKENP